MKTKSSVFLNIGSSILPQLVNIITNLIIPSLIISFYGSEINGLISTSKTIVTYISLVGAGLAAAVTQALYKPVAEGNDITVRGMLHAADKMFIKCGVIYCIILFLVAFFYPFLLKTDIDYLTIAGLLIVMGISGASEFFVVGRCRALLYANQKVYVCTLIQAASLTISLVLSILMLRMRANIVVVELMMSAVYIIRAVFLQVYVSIKYPKYGKIREVEPIKESVKKKNDAMIHQLTGLAVTGSQSLILSLIVGLEAASVYAVYNLVFSGLLSICTNIATAITPYLGRGYALDNKETIIRKYNLVEFAFSIFTVFVFSVSSVTIIPFVRIYTLNADINYIYPIFGLMFVFVAFFNAVRLPENAMINVAGHFKETRTRAIIEASICVGLSLICTYFFGVYGVLIGTGCALGWRCLDMILYTNKYILDNTSKKSLLRLLVCVLTIGLSSVFGYLYSPSFNGYFKWVLYALLVSFILIIVIVIEVAIFERSAFKSLFISLKRKS